MKKHIGNVIKLALSLGIGVGLIYWFVGQMKPDEIQLTIDAFKRTDYRWIMLAPIMGLVSNISRAERWRMLLEPTGHKPGFWNTYFSVMMMYLFNLFLPRLGEVTRCTVLARYENVPVDKSIGTMVVERLVDLICILVIGFALFAAEHERLSAPFADIFQNLNSKVSHIDPIRLIMGGSILVIALGSTFYFIRKKMSGDLGKSLMARLMGFLEGLKSIKSVRNPVMFLVHTVAIWLCYYLMIYLSFYALSDTANVGVWAGAACLFFGGFAMVATPGGTGAYPLAISKMLLLYGISETVGYAFGSIVWAAQMGSVLIGGVISLILLAILNREPALEQ